MLFQSSILHRYSYHDGHWLGNCTSFICDVLNGAGECIHSEWRKTFACMSACAYKLDDVLVKQCKEKENTTGLLSFIFTFIMCGLLTKCEVNMAGYWPSSFFACLWTEMESRSINMQKKNEVKKWTTPISSHLDQTSLVNKGFTIWLSGKCFLRDTVSSPERVVKYLFPKKAW